MHIDTLVAENRRLQVELTLALSTSTASPAAKLVDTPPAAAAALSMPSTDLKSPARRASTKYPPRRATEALRSAIAAAAAASTVPKVAAEAPEPPAKRPSIAVVPVVASPPMPTPPENLELIFCAIEHVEAQERRRSQSAVDTTPATISSCSSPSAKRRYAGSPRKYVILDGAGAILPPSRRLVLTS